MPEMNIGRLRASTLYMRTVAAIVLVTFTTVTLSPGAQAIAQTLEQPAPAPAPQPDPQSDPIERLRAELQQLQRSDEASQRLAQRKATLRELRAELRSRRDKMEAEFAEVEQHLTRVNAPEAIKRRHEEAVAAFAREAGATDAELAQIETTEDPRSVAERSGSLRQKLDPLRSKRPHQSFDPRNLPFRSPEEKVRAPKVKPDDFTAMFPPEPLLGLRLASISPWATLPLLQAGGSAPGPEFLAATEDVQITQPVRDLATQLQNDPVAIYNWVRNNIEYVPTYGSMQGSDVLLQSRRGNAFDTSSLLIALLRAAGVPARYAYGTIEMPIEQLKNWAGGFEDAQAALDFVGQGGIPVMGLAQSGTIKSARMEHVWVEAFVDFVPSRGARNRVPDTWVALDASFKQYQQVAGVLSEDLTNDIKQAAAGFLQTANSTPGAAWATGFDTTVLNDELEALQAQIADAVAANPEKFTIGEVLGQRVIVQSSAPILPASLPYKLNIVGQRFAALPPSLRVTATISLSYAGLYEEDGTQLLSHTVSLPSAGYGSVHLTHVPATPDDAAVWQSYKDANAQQFPVYLINARAQLSLNGVMQAQSPAMQLGRDIVLRVTYSGAGQNQSARFVLVSGDEVNIGLNGAGQAPEQGTVLRDRTDRDTAAGNLFVANKVFWTQQDFHDRLYGQLHKVAVARLPSVGIFCAPLSVVYSFGVPRFGSYHSRQVDVKLSRISAAALNGDRERTVLFVTHSGITASSTEGAVIEQVFNKPIGVGSNTARLLELANTQRIPIYRLTAENYAANRAQLQHSPEVMADIGNAVAAGLDVVIPQRTQTNGTWTGSGYIMLDPETGSGDYRVSGGLSGNFTDDPCERLVEPVAVREPSVSFIYFMLFGYLVDEDFNFNGVGIATVLAQIAAVAIIGVVAAPALAGMAVLGRTMFATTALLISGAVAAEDSVDDQCACQYVQVRPRRGGRSPFTARHNACADVWTDAPFVGADIRVAGIHFDGLFTASNTLTEVKTGGFYGTIKSLPNITPSRQRFLDFLLAKSILDYYRERIPSAVCGYDFYFGVRDPLMLVDMRAFLASTPLEQARVLPNGCP